MQYFAGRHLKKVAISALTDFPFHTIPTTSFTGIRLPAGDKARGMLLTDTTHRVDVVTLDADGNPVSRDRVEMSMYKLEWRWWWDSEGEDANYMSSPFRSRLPGVR